MPFEVIMPNLGAANENSTLLRWLVLPGDEVQRGQLLFEAESDKATVEIEAGESGRFMPLVRAGDIAEVGQVIGILLRPGEEYKGQEVLKNKTHSTFAADPARSIALPASNPETSTKSRSGRLVITPLARRLAAQEAVDITQIHGSGPRGRIVATDVQQVLQKRAERAPSLGEKYSTSNLRGMIARRMVESAQTTAPVTLVTEGNAERLIALREKLEWHPGLPGEWVSYDLLIAWITGQALLNYPILNASWTVDGIVFHDRVNIGVAVDTESGLIVPVLKNVTQRPLIELGKELSGLIDRARAGRSFPEDLQAGTFTITNLGQFGIDAFTPVINLPECAILGIGRIRRSPIEREGVLTMGKVITLSLTFDHRIVDGAPAARFLQQLIQFVEMPEKLRT
ncbi:MAG TPA: dihydrolipoamide acetyltransferase family protein [Anaerolineaceae bacterium]|nr:dihydrolipoamide acetyltransferase family protein [Anaerolineaceae bacterium]